MKGKILNFLLIFTSLFGYLEWGNNNSSFLFQMEYLILTQIFTDIKSVIHPFILLPLFGQLLILITLFQKRPGKVLIFVGIACLGLLLGLMFFIGILGMNLKIIASTLPFILTAIFTIWSAKRQKIDNNTLPLTKSNWSRNQFLFVMDIGCCIHGRY